jgi:hypothetical protein
MQERKDGNDMREEPIDTIEYKGFKINIYSDFDPMNPRTEWDNFGHMICFHGRYNLGDKHSMSIEEVHELVKRKDVIYLDLYLYDHSGLTLKSSTNGNPFYGRLPQGHAEWDSGQVGIIYVTFEEVRKEWSKKKLSKAIKQKAMDCLEAETEVYGQYLSGDVYGYNVTSLEDEDIGVSGCWGFFGYDWKENGLLESAQEEIETILDAMAINKQQEIEA